MKTVKWSKKIALILCFLLIFICTPSITMADSVGDNISQLVDCLREGDISDAQSYNQQLPKVATESCLHSMPKLAKEAYKKEVQKWENTKEEGIYSFYDYWLTDIDNDGTAELLVDMMPSYAGAITHVFTYKDGSVVEVGTISGNETCHAYPYHNGMITEGAKQGYNWLSLVKIEDEELVAESLVTYGDGNLSADDYFGMRNKLKSHSEYVNGRYVPDYEDLEENVDKPFKLSGITYQHNLEYYAEHLDTSTFDNNLCSLMAAIVNSSGNKSSIKSMYKTLGFSQDDYIIRNYDDPSFFVEIRDGITYSIGEKYASNGMRVVLVDIKGTGNTSDIVHDITVNGMDDDNYSVHQGFSIAASEIYDNLINFLGYEPEYDDNTRYFIVGHSLGAAAGNLLAAELSVWVGKDSVFNYNFACPNTVTSTESILDNPNAYNENNAHSNIFNICRATDRVPALPGLESSMLLEVKEYAQYGWDIAQCFHTKHDYYWGRYGITKWFNDGIWVIGDAHDMGNYLNFVSGSNPTYTTTPTYGDNFTYVMNNVFALCPVDVEIVDSNGKIVAEIIDDKPVYYDNSERDIYIATIDDEKCISYPPDRNYKVRLKGTDVGGMEYIVAEGSPDDTLYKNSVIFSNVSLTDGKKMRGIIDNDDIINSRLFVENADGIVTKDIGSDGKETDHEHVWDSTYTIDIPATCTNEGSESIYCKCGDKKEGSTRAIPKIAHKYSSWTTTKAATELGAGKKSRTCSACGKTETKTVAQLKPTLPSITIVTPVAAKKAATIKWKKVSTKNKKKIAKIQIQYSMDKTFKTGVKTVYAKKSAASKKITKLKSKKTYYIRIRAYKKSGEAVHVSKWSKKKSVKIK